MINVFPAVKRKFRIKGLESVKFFLPVSFNIPFKFFKTDKLIKGKTDNLAKPEKTKKDNKDRRPSRLVPRKKESANQSGPA